MKKLAVLLAAVMVLGLFPGTGYATGENLFENSNPGFENWYWGSDSLYKCKNWKINGALKNGTMRQSTDIKKSGEAALRIEPTAAARSLIYQDPMAAYPGAEYTFDFWFYGISGKANNGNVDIEFEFYEKDGEGNFVSLGRDVSFTPEITEKETWLNLSFSAEVPMDCAVPYIRPIVNIYAPGGGVMDDVCLKMTHEPAYGEVATDSIFYYKEEIRQGAAGEAVVTLNPYFAPSDYMAGAVLYSPNGAALTLEERVPFSEEGKAALSFPLSLLTEEKKAYTVEARIYSASAAASASPLWTEEKNVYVYNRPLAFDAEGNYRRMKFDVTGNPIKSGGKYVLENEIFQPTLAYHVSQPGAKTQDADNMYLQAQRAGVNVVQLSRYYSDPARIEKALDTCQAYGLMGLVCLYRDNVPAGNVTEQIADSTGALVTNAENTKKVVEIAKDHPATFAYAVKDEPFSHMTPTMEADLENSYKIIRNIDDVHPVYIVDTADVERLAKYADICAIDPYPKSADKSGTAAAYHTGRAVAAAKGKKPVYVIMQAFCYGDTNDDDVHDYFPSWEEMRHMWYQSLAAGAKAVGYYSFDTPLSEIGDKETTINETVVWSGMTGFAKREMEESYTFFRESTLLESYESEAGWVQIRAWNGERYAVVLSKSSTAQDAAVLTASSVFIRDVYMGKGGSIREIDGDKWTLTLPGSCADIYRLQTGGLFLSRGGYVASVASAEETLAAVAILEVGKPFSLVRAVYGTAGGAKELLHYTVMTEGTGKLEFSETINLTDFPGASEIKLFVLTSPFPNAAACKAETRIEK